MKLKSLKSETFNAWVAGFWEGEGCICKQKSQHSYFVEIAQSIYSKRDVINCIKKIQKKFGGTISTYNPKNKKRRTMMTWHLGRGSDVIQFVKTIYPYCQLRKEDLKVALICFKKHNIKKDVDIEILKKLRRKNKTYQAMAYILKMPLSSVWLRLKVDECINFWANIIALQRNISSIDNTNR